MGCCELCFASEVSSKISVTEIRTRTANLAGFQHIKLSEAMAVSQRLFLHPYALLSLAYHALRILISQPGSLLLRVLSPDAAWIWLYVFSCKRSYCFLYVNVF